LVQLCAVAPLREIQNRTLSKFPVQAKQVVISGSFLIAAKPFIDPEMIYIWPIHFRMVKSLFSKPVYLFLLPVFFVFHGYMLNFSLIPVKDALLLALLYLCISFILVFLTRLYFKSFAKAALFTFLLMGFYLFFGYIHDALKLLVPGSFLVKYSVFLPVAFVVFVVFAILLKKKKSIPARLILYLNLLFCIFILIDTGSLVRKNIIVKKAEFISLTCGNKQLPDVYLIVPDEYAGNKDLTSFCKFDNSDFLDSLRQRGFLVAANSRSNYDFTIQSIASLLNMDYLPLNAKEIRQDNPAPALQMILENKVTASFSKAGYGIYNLSEFDIKDQPAQKNNSFIPSRTTLFTSQTLGTRLKRDAWIRFAMKYNLRSVVKDYAYQIMRYNKFIYEESLKVPHLNTMNPKFVYSHLEIPHFPYYYDENGNAYSYEELIKDSPSNTKNYVRYIKYANTLLLTLVDEIIRYNRTPPIIILMSDHGYRCFPGDERDYKFINFFSVYLPNKNYARFNDSQLNVNVFRTLFNTEFCQQLPMLKDSAIEVP
jgi:hypothetical protein